LSLTCSVKPDDTNIARGARRHCWRRWRRRRRRRSFSPLIDWKDAKIVADQRRRFNDRNAFQRCINYDVCKYILPHKSNWKFWQVPSFYASRRNCARQHNLYTVTCNLERAKTLMGSVCSPAVPSSRHPSPPPRPLPLPLPLPLPCRTLCARLRSLSTEGRRDNLGQT